MTERKRIEFDKKTKLEMFRRAGGPECLCCEGCGLPLRGKPFEYDHQPEIWEWTEERYQRALREGLTAEDGKLLGYCCHKPKTAESAGKRAHGKRIVERTAKVRKISRPIPGSKASGWKHKMDGSWKRR